MSDSVWIGIVTGISVALAFAVLARRGEKLQPKIRGALEAAGGTLLLPELAVGVGMKDSFLNRGKIIQAIAPLIQSGDVIEEDDPNATVKDRLDRKRFRLRAPSG